MANKHGFNIRMLNGTGDGVGIVASTQRVIEDGKKFNSYFPVPSYSDPMLSTNGDEKETLLVFIPKVVRKYLSDTATIANLLKRDSLEETCRTVWNFVYNHIQYKLDAPHEEQIRRPARSWADRKSGVDCDCYTVFISSILTNLNIPHHLRMTAYSKHRGYQHVYVIVPKKYGANTKNRAEYYTLDCVLDSFNSEKPYLYKLDKNMQEVNYGLNGMPIRMLNGQNVQFSKKTPVVYPNVFYSPKLKTWALKGIDNGYYIQGDYNNRIVPSLDGVDGLGFIDTAVKVAGGIFKIGKSLFGRRKKKRAAKKAKRRAAKLEKSQAQGASSATQTTPNYPVVPITPQTSPQQANNSLQISNNLTKDISDLDQKLSSINTTTVMSIDSLSKDNKKTLDRISSFVGEKLEKVGLNKDETAKQIKDLTQIALMSANSQTKKQNDISTQTNEVQKNVKIETLKNEEFRTGIKKHQTLLIIGLSVVVLAVLYMSINTNKKSKLETNN
jgi:hypothetical protein